MRSVFENAGFTWIPKSQIDLSNSSQLVRGDILLNEAKHTEIYIGNNQRVGAHTGTYDKYDSNSPGDNNGIEIFIYNYSNSSNWDGILRYNDGPISLFGFDSPVENQEISDRSFVFQGWVTAEKQINSITCSVNDGQKYILANLYTREDVPFATAFRADVPTACLNMGTNKIAVCVNFTDGTGVVAGSRSVIRTRPTVIAAVDTPTEGQHINEEKFLFQGWVDADKEIDTITVRVNNGAYYNLGLYIRDDVPYATAFRREFPSDYLSYGENSVALCVNFKDGTGAVPIVRNFIKDYEVAVDNPRNNETINTDKFVVQGWAASSKDIKSVKCLINGEKYKDMGLYKRDDVPFATAFRREIFTSELTEGSNTIAIVVEYTDGTKITARERTIIRDYNEPITEPTNYILGDVDGDDEVNAYDVTFIQRYIADMSVKSFDEQAADADGDGDVTAFDVTFIQRYLAGFETSYPIGEKVVKQ